MNQSFYSEMRKMAEPGPPKGVDLKEWDKYLQKNYPGSTVRVKEKTAAGVLPSILAETLGRAKVIEGQSPETKTLKGVTTGLGVLGTGAGTLMNNPALSIAGSLLKNAPGIHEDFRATQEGVRGARGMRFIGADDQIRRNIKRSGSLNMMSGIGSIGASGAAAGLRSAGMGFPGMGIATNFGIKPGLRYGLGKLKSREGEGTLSMSGAERMRKQMGVQSPIYLGDPGMSEGTVVQKGSFLDTLKRMVGLGPKLHDRKQEDRLYREGGVVVPFVKNSSAWPTLASSLVR